jgi:hypothetical protein
MHSICNYAHVVASRFKAQGQHLPNSIGSSFVASALRNRPTSRKIKIQASYHAPVESLKELSSLSTVREVTFELWWWLDWQASSFWGHRDHGGWHVVAGCDQRPEVVLSSS